MAEASDKMGILRQNLTDAGCDGDTAAHCMASAKRGEWDELAAALIRHRAALLETVHENQRRIDCVDYLVYRIHQENKREERK